MINKNNKRIIVDAHSDIPYEVFLRKIDGEQRVLDKRQADRLKSGGINLPVFAIYVEARYKPDRSLEIALRQTEALLKDLEESSDFMLIKTKDDLNKFIIQDKIGVILDMEGAEPLESGIEMLYLFYRLGVRIIGLTWNQRNALADGIDELGTHSGLTKYGRQVVEEANKLGIIIDVSHLSPSCVDDVLKYSTMPVIASHCGAKGVYDHPRNLSDEHIKRIAKSGGVIGIPVFPTIISSGIPTVENVVDHIEYIINIAGKEHVGFGSDFVEFFSDLVNEGKMGTEWIVKPGEETQGMSRPSDMQNLIDSMKRRGFSSDLINGVLGENFFRVFKNTLPDK